MNRNQHRNRLNTPLVVRLVFFLVLAGMFGGSYAVIQNNHIKTGDAIRMEEERMDNLQRESDMWELRIASLMDRRDLERHLRWVHSDLEEIIPAQIVRINLDDSGNDSLVTMPAQIAAN